METGAVVNLRLMQKWFRNVLEYLESVSPNKIFYFFKMPWNLGQRCEWNVGKGLRPTDPELTHIQKQSSILLPQIAVLTDTPEDARGGVLCDARGEPSVTVVYFLPCVAYYRFNLDLVYDVCMLMVFESCPRCTRYIHVYDSLHVSYMFTYAACTFNFRKSNDLQEHEWLVATHLHQL